MKTNQVWNILHGFTMSKQIFNENFSQYFSKKLTRVSAAGVKDDLIITCHTITQFTMDTKIAFLPDCQYFIFSHRHYWSMVRSPLGSIYSMMLQEA